MKKLTLFLSSFLLLFVFLTPSFAQEETDESTFSEGVSSEVKMIAPDYIVPPNPSEPGFLGQDHSYSLVFRGNGEAVVSARIIFTNKSEQALQEVKLRVPRVQPREISVYQVIRERRCVRYEVREYDPEIRTYKPQECAEYAEPDYYESYYSNAKYQKAKYNLDIDTLKIELPSEVKPDKSGSFFIYYRAIGYAKKNMFGAFTYTFETLKAEDDVRNLRIGIGTDSDLILRGVKAEVSYRFEEPGFAALEAGGIAMAPQKSVALDTYVSRIGQGRLTKTASNLAPLESYTVKGAYASSYAKLYGKEILISLLVAAVSIAAGVFLIRLGIKKLRKVTTPKEAVEKGKTVVETGNMFLITCGISFVSSILISGYTVGIYVLGDLLGSLVGYRYQALFAIFLILISFVIYAVLLFAPGIFLGVKKGVGWGIASVVATVIWLLFFMLVIIVIIFLFARSGRSGPIVPLFESVVR